jgi:predicted nucleic acid-binding protein
MLDTTVYVDGRRLPPPVAAVVARNMIFHSATSLAELAISIGHLDPGDPRTPRTRQSIDEIMERAEPTRIIAPSPDVWTEAAVLTGILARIQSVPKQDRRRLLNDALILLTAAEVGATLISRNISDMDLLLQIKPDVSVLLYDMPQAGKGIS